MRRTIFTEEHTLFRDAFRHFVEKEMVSFNEQWEKDGMVSRELWLKAGQQGFLGWCVPEEYGGAGTSDFRYSAIFAEEIVRALNGMPSNLRTRLASSLAPKPAEITPLSVLHAVS